MQSEIVRIKAETMLKELINTLHSDSIKWDRMIGKEEISTIVMEQATVIAQEGIE